MSEAVLVAIITGGLSLLGVIYSQRKSQAEVIAKLEASSQHSDDKLSAEIAVMKTQMEELTREVRRHNNFAERVPLVEQRVDQLERKIGS